MNIADEYVTCLLCGTDSLHVLNGHLPAVHGIDSATYKKMFPKAETQSKFTMQLIKVNGLKRQHEDPYVS